MRHVIVRSTTLLFALALLAAPASAQIVQSLHLGGGVFIPKGYSSRATGDVLVADLNDLDFPKCTATRLESCIREEFTSGQVFGEWLVAFSDHLEVGAGLGFHSRSRPTVYAAYTNVGGSEIRQQLHLRVVPITGVVRFLAGHPGTFQPYFGVGVAALNYRYTEEGDFIDFTQLLADGTFVVFPDRFVATGTAVGPAVLAGFRVPIKGDIWGFTTEWRYQGGVGKTGGLAAGFLDDKIDLGGNSINFGVLVHF